MRLLVVAWWLVVLWLAGVLVGLVPGPLVILVRVAEGASSSASGGAGGGVGGAGSGVGSGVVVVGSLRRGEGGLGRFLRSVAELWVAGGGVDWGGRVQGVWWCACGVALVCVPKRQRFWLAGGAGAGDVRLRLAKHRPVIRCWARWSGWLRVVGCVFTGRVSLESDPWLSDHAVSGVVLLAGTAFLELALHAGGMVGCPVVRELTLEVPLVLGERGGVQVQVVVGEAGEGGERTVGGSDPRPEDAGGGLDGALDGGVGGGGGWTRHASGALALEELDGVGPDGVGEGRGALNARAEELAGSCLPPGAEMVGVDDAYERLVDMGVEYGPAFQGLRAAWRRGEEVFAEVVLDEQQAGEAANQGVYPALLDSALHASALALPGEGVSGDGKGGASVRLPFVWGGVRLGTRGRLVIAGLRLAGG